MGRPGLPGTVRQGAPALPRGAPPAVHCRFVVTLHAATRRGVSRRGAIPWNERLAPNNTVASGAELRIGGDRFHGVRRRVWAHDRGHRDRVQPRILREVRRLFRRSRCGASDRGDGTGPRRGLLAAAARCVRRSAQRADARCRRARHDSRGSGATRRAERPARAVVVGRTPRGRLQAHDLGPLSWPLALTLEPMVRARGDRASGAESRSFNRTSVLSVACRRREARRRWRTRRSLRGRWSGGDSSARERRTPYRCRSSSTRRGHALSA
jgi:hypothetical protein